MHRSAMAANEARVMFAATTMGTLNPNQVQHKVLDLDHDQVVNAVKDEAKE